MSGSIFDDLTGTHFATSCNILQHLAKWSVLKPLLLEYYMGRDSDVSYPMYWADHNPSWASPKGCLGIWMANLHRKPFKFGVKPRYDHVVFCRFSLKPIHSSWNLGKLRGDIYCRTAGPTASQSGSGWVMGKNSGCTVVHLGPLAAEVGRLERGGRSGRQTVP